MPRDEVHRKWRDKGRPGAALGDDPGVYCVKTFSDAAEMERLFESISDTLSKSGENSDEGGDLSRLEKDRLIEIIDEKDRKIRQVKGEIETTIADLKKKISSGYVGVYERMLLFDAVGRSSLSHNLKLTELPPLEPNPDEMRTSFKLAVLETAFGLDPDRPKKGKPAHLKLDATLAFDIDWHAGGWAPRDDFDCAFWHDMFLRQLDYALGNGADVICAGEFGFPESKNATTTETFLQDIRDRLSRAGRPVMLIGGSRHRPHNDDSSPFNENVALLFAADADAPSSADQPHLHYKVSPASRIGEKLFVGGTTSLPVYRTPFGNIGVLVCSDAFDMRIHLSYLRDNNILRRKVQVILVPSFNRSDLLVECCRYLSYLAGCIVIYINSADGDFARHSVQKFLCGLQDRDLEPFSRKYTQAFQGEYSASNPIYECIRSEDPVQISSTESDSDMQHAFTRRVSMHTVDTNRLLAVRNAVGAMSGELVNAARDIGTEYKL